MQRKQVHPSFLHFFIQSTNICRSPEQFLRTRRGASKDGSGIISPSERTGHGGGYRKSVNNRNTQ